ncbi:YheT family hydrolase [Rhodovibrionaceae bacterium A322]
MTAFLPDPLFTARFPWIGGDLQTLCWSIRTWLGQGVSLSRWPAEDLRLELADGDVMIGRLHRPQASDQQVARPLVLLLHGLTGDENSPYMRETAAHFLEQGWPVLRLNLRGAGPSKDLCKSLYHSGRSEDFCEVLALLQQNRGELLQAGYCAIGYSLGGNLLLKALAESDLPLAPLAAASVSGPLDLKKTALRLDVWRNRPYQKNLLKNMRAELKGKLPDDLDRAARAAKSVYDLDDRVTAPWHGFRSADDYYRRSSAGARLKEIKHPTLIIHADDDPWVPVALYRSLEWWQPGHPVQLVVTRSGGHVGFHAQGHKRAWFCSQILKFFVAQLPV